MAYQELDAYVAEQIAQGIDAKTIKEVLLEAGWKEMDVDNALRDIAADAVPNTAVSVHDDILRMRHALNDMDHRVRQLETRLVGAPGEMLPSGTADTDHQIESHTHSPSKRILTYTGLAVLFMLIGYAGMSTIVSDSITPVSRIWAEVVVGGVLASVGFVAGRMKKRGVANLLTGAGLSLAALATVGAWYVHYVDWSVAAALGALLVTMALVMGRFYDHWSLVRPHPTNMA